MTNVSQERTTAVRLTFEPATVSYPPVQREEMAQRVDGRVDLDYGSTLSSLAARCSARRMRLGSGAYTMIVSKSPMKAF